MCNCVSVFEGCGQKQLLSSGAENFLSSRVRSASLNQLYDHTQLPIVSWSLNSHLAINSEFRIPNSELFKISVT